MAQFFYLTGPDGCGKTTYLKKIEAHFLERGVETFHIWLRSPKIFSKPLMAYCRLAGLTRYKTIEGIRYGGHFFKDSTFVSHVFPWLQLIDFRIKLRSFSTVLKLGGIVLMDRFALDTLADLMVDTERFDLHETRVGKMYLDLIPKNTKIIVLSTSEENIRKRKTDTLHDPLLRKKLKAYAILSRDLDLKVVDNNRAFQLVKKDIWNTFSL